MLKQKFFNHNLLTLLSYFLLSYPMFYYAYKFGVPDFGNIDFYDYYHLYKNWDFSKVRSPFNTRLVSSFFIYLFNKIGFFYNAEISYHHPGIDQKVFFNAIFFNYISLVFTAFTIYKMIVYLYKNKVFAWTIGLLVFLGFGSLFYSINTLTESFSFLLFAVIYFLYLQKNKSWIFVLLMIAVIQREYIFLVLGLVSLIEYIIKENKKYYLLIFISSILFFSIYYILRKTIFYTEDYSYQLNIYRLIENLFNPQFPIAPYIRQSLLNQNILILYLLIIFYKYLNKLNLNCINLLITIALILQSHFISFAAVLGNSCGRYFYITLPILLYFISEEIYPLIFNYYTNPNKEHSDL